MVVSGSSFSFVINKCPPQGDYDNGLRDKSISCFCVDKICMLNYGISPTGWREGELVEGLPTVTPAWESIRSEQRADKASEQGP